MGSDRATIAPGHYWIPNGSQDKSLRSLRAMIERTSYNRVIPVTAKDEAAAQAEVERLKSQGKIDLPDIGDSGDWDHIESVCEEGDAGIEIEAVSVVEPVSK